RAYIGLPADMDFIDRQIGSQLWRFDENGMYRDPHNPMVYDLVSRALAAFILKSGYRGCYAEELRAQLRKSVDITIAMLSVDGEIPFGGRSNQMLMTEGWYAAVCEYYLSELPKDDGRRGLLASCLAAAKKFTADWLGMDGFRHVKNFYPTDSPVGCEGYAYFDKYMVTLGSVYTLAALLSDGAEITPRERDSFITATGPDFHKIFLYNGTIFAEYETKADPAYDANGIGRVHFRGAPPQLVLSVPCPASGGNYTLDESSGLPLSICPVLCEDGIVTACSGASFEPDEMRENGDRVFLSMETTLETGDELTESVLLDGERFVYTVGGDAICGAAFPVFLSDGAEHTKIVMDGQSLTVTYRGYTARYETDGVIENTGHICANRNGLYAFYTAAGDGGVTLTVTVSKNSKRE
ncbi:MAG: hypothetical protein MJ175_02880, partial [Clostridia bacterium]|nr:hypothetical protein [Clostridia bacterium]